ncbi:MAG: GNAT family N-acetyltransferase [Gemmatimonadales bacterium]
MQIRYYDGADRSEWQRMRTALWPDQSSAEMEEWLGRADAAVIVADSGAGELCGFVEVGERSIADGCASSPVAYVEGWWVDPDVRRRGIGGRLIAEAEAWASTRGRSELASDTTLGNTVSQKAHVRLGFVEVERAVLYRKVVTVKGTCGS